MKMHRREVEKQPKLNINVTQKELVREIRKIRPLKYSICIITNNAEDMIRRTLESVQPLLKAVPGEIIVTDTGCTDKTMDIVREYTDKINFFKWTGSFSDARNKGLELAQGEWFIDIDNDEWFEDVNELIEFFQSGECDKYNCGSYLQKNYLDYAGTNYNYFRRLSMARNVQGFHFEGVIHETPKPVLSPCKLFDLYVHHYGYVTEGKKKKQDRNIPLMEEQLKLTPNSPRMIFQMAQEYIATKEYDKALEYCERGLALTEEQTKGLDGSVDMFRQPIVFCYASMGKPQEAINIGEEFLRGEMVLEERLAISYCLELSATTLKQYDNVIRFGKEFVQTFHYLEEHPEKANRVAWVNAEQYRQEGFLASGLHQIYQAYLENKNYEEAETYLEEINCTQPGKIRFRAFASAFTLALRANRDEIITHYCEKAQSIAGAMHEFREAYCDALIQYPDERHRFLKAMASSKIKDTYIRYIILLLDDIEERTEQVAEGLQYFSENNIECCDEYTDVLTLCMKYDRNLESLLKNLDMEDWQNYIVEAASSFGNAKMTIMIRYCLQHTLDLNDLKQAYMLCCVKEKICLNGVFEKKEDISPSLWDYADTLAPYAHRLYRDEMFEPQNLPYLPRVYRFARYMELAKQQKAEGKLTDYLASLKNAMESYPVVRKQIKVLIDKFEYEQLAENRHAQEFFELAKQVKQQIELLLTQKQAAGARALIDELSALLPNDEDLQKYRLMAEQIETETLAQNVKQ